jgi:hypothetical protein
VRWRLGIGPGEVEEGWVEYDWVVLGFWVDRFLFLGVVDWVGSARSTAPTKIIKSFIYFKCTFCKPIADKQNILETRFWF